MMYDEDKVCVVGHPFASHGMGEHVRCVSRSLSAAGVSNGVYNVYKGYNIDQSYTGEFEPLLQSRLADINIFCINGDEVEQVLLILRGQFENKFNIIYPAWELAMYPSVWLGWLAKFDDIWAPSSFVENSIRRVSTLEPVTMLLACEPGSTSFLPRQYFGLRGSSFIFLFIYDNKSYVDRKNPRAVINAFVKVKIAEPWRDIQLIIKITSAEKDKKFEQDLEAIPKEIRAQIQIYVERFTDNDVKALIASVDCVVSLHRSEGFGRLLSEALFFGVPVIATGYGGNMDYMNNKNSLLVDYKMIPVKEDEYPHGSGQVWAEADIDAAAEAMLDVLRRPTEARVRSMQGRIDCLVQLSYVAAGARYLNRMRDRAGSW